MDRRYYDNLIHKAYLMRDTGILRRMLNEGYMDEHQYRTYMRAINDSFTRIEKTPNGNIVTTKKEMNGTEMVHVIKGLEQNRRMLLIG